MLVRVFTCQNALAQFIFMQEWRFAGGPMVAQHCILAV